MYKSISYLKGYSLTFGSLTIRISGSSVFTQSVKRFASAEFEMGSLDLAGFWLLLVTFSLLFVTFVFWLDVDFEVVAFAAILLEAMVGLGSPCGYGREKNEIIVIAGAYAHQPIATSKSTYRIGSWRFQTHVVLLKSVIFHTNRQLFRSGNFVE